MKEILYQQTFGFTKNDELLSGKIRLGMIEREPVLERLEYDNILPTEAIGAFLAENGFDMTRLQASLQRYRESVK